MDTPLLDLSFLYDLADDDTVYVNEVIKLFLNTVPAGLQNLEHGIKETNDFEAIHRQAHSLKSSAGIIKIRGLYDGLVAIEMLAREKRGKAEMLVQLEEILATFKEALPEIEAEKKKTSVPAAG